MAKYFFDIHCHAMNLSHPNLLAFIKRLIPDIKESILGRYRILKILVLILLILIFPLLIVLYLVSQRIKPVRRFIKNLPRLLGLSKIVNLLSIMENNLGDYFLLMEKDVVHFKEKNGNKIIIGGQQYDKVILTPLIMDFGSKWVGTFPNIHYKRLSSKPVVDQVLDIFNGIRKYLHESQDKLLEIYPFLGINPQNYYLKDETTEIVREKPDLDALPPEISEKIQVIPGNKRNNEAFKFIFFGEMKNDEMEMIRGLFSDEEDREKIKTVFEQSQDIISRNTVSKMLSKYFSNYSANYDEFRSNLGQFDGNIEHLGSNFFAGIKVYPPLGFNPWPDKNTDGIEYEKVYLLYDFCVKRNIPLTTHCSKGGFRVIDKALSQEYSSPSKWRQVLKEFPGLKLNFAHFGGEENLIKDDWAKEIIELILDDDYPDVYTDISDLYPKAGDYKWLQSLFESIETEADLVKLKKRVMFGTDFMINLRKSASYEACIEGYSDTEYLKDSKDLLSSKNPERFIFSPL